MRVFVNNENKTKGRFLRNVRKEANNYETYVLKVTFENKKDSKDWFSHYFYCQKEYKFLNKFFEEEIKFYKNYKVKSIDSLEVF